VLISINNLKMDLQSSLTLPGYSWRREKHVGDKGGGTELTRLLITYV
jgi:hypothetical protein